MLKQTLKSQIGHAANLLGFNQRKRKEKVTIFMYHRVLTPAQYEACQFEKSLAIETTAFRKHLAYVKANFEVISPKTFLQLNKNAATLKRTSNKPLALLTFDDGWRDNFENAFPLLQEFQLPAVIFLATGFIGTDKGFWWQLLGDALIHLIQEGDHQKWQQVTDKLPKSMGMGKNIPMEVASLQSIIYQAKQLPSRQLNELADTIYQIAELPIATHALNWEQVKIMSREGIYFGAHTIDHAILTELDQAATEKQIIQSIETIKEQGLTNYTPIFCYPNGDWNSTVLDVLKKTDSLAAVTTETALADPQTKQPFLHPRINVTNALADDPGLLEFRLFRAGVTKAVH